MRLAPILATTLALTLPASAQTPEAEPIRLAADPALSPDGSTLVFSWSGDLWSVPTAGGVAQPLTRHPARDRDPSFSPDGKQIAFVSDREGSNQVYIMPAQGGVPRQVTFHTAGSTVEGWFPDGKALLVSAARDHGWNGRGSQRFFKVSADQRAAEQLLFDDYGANGDLAPDGKSLLFTREGAQWWRKGYRGSQASQVWSYDLESKAFQKRVDDEYGGLWPIWKPDGKGFYYVGAVKGVFNLRERDLATGDDRALTSFEDDSVVFPCISRDGSTIVFRHLFDFYAYHPGNGTPAKIAISQAADPVAARVERRVLTSADQVAFNKDGLEIAFTAGGDLWVMDTELREPRQVTSTPEEERDPVFAPDGSAIYYVSDAEGQPDVWKAARADGDKYWWQNLDFKREKLTADPEPEADLKFSPDGSKLAFVKGGGDLWVMNPDGKEPKKVIPSWNAPEFDWSPDGKWFAYSHEDDDFNDDIWIAPVDGSRAPFNLSRHPDDEGRPVWSPDGKAIAFTGRRAGEEVDIYFVYLAAKDDDQGRRERTLEKALEKMKSAGKRGGNGGGPPAAGGAPGSTPAPSDPPAGRGPRRGGGRPGPDLDLDLNSDQDKPAEPKADEPKADEAKKDEPRKEEPKKVPEVVIDFDDIHERIRRVVIPNSSEGGLLWSPDSKKLAFLASVDGQRGMYTIEPPDDLTPKKLTATTGTQARWLESGNQIVLLTTGGTPASIAAAGGRESTYRIAAPQQVDLPAKYRAAFDLAWRTMRDRWYDERLGNRNWDAVRRKFAEMAGQAPDVETLATVVQLMLGELNGSHLGFTPTSGASRRGPAPGPSPTPSPDPGNEPPAPSGSWTPVTPHLGLRFDDAHPGPGLKVRDVIEGGPTSKTQSKVEPGEVVLRVDGTPVDPSMDLTQVLNGPLARDIRLTVRNAKGEDREVVVRPIPYAAVPGLLYAKWIKDNRKAVDAASKGTLGYLHIRGMDQSSFLKFEEELYSAGAGKDGLIIDVRENGGGSTADLLLTALTQPLHAITVPRGGGPGYPQDRMVFATWRKPIVVLCNQNSFSNAEIFSHAVKTLKRGKLVGVPTAGGVISTGGTRIMDVGFLRLPGRGWYLRDTGEDMELNGAVPDIVVWPAPGDMPRGKDDQLARAVEQLTADVAAEKAQPKPKLRKATER